MGKLSYQVVPLDFIQHAAVTVPADGRLAVNVGTVALVYQPRFEGRERYGFTAFSAPCPEGDSTIMDLQRFPGKVRGVSGPGSVVGKRVSP